MFGRSGALTLTQRLFLLTAVALLPAFLILLYNVVVLGNQRDKELHTQARQAGQIAALELDRIIYGAEDVLRALAASPEARSPEVRDCSGYLRRVNAEIARFWAIRIIAGSGRMICTSEPSLSDISLADRSYLSEARETGKFVVGTFTVDRVDGHKVLPLALPMKGVDAVIVGTLDLDWLGGRLREREYSRDSALTIADRDGVILAREPFPERFVGTKIPDSFMPLIRADFPGTREVTSQDGTRRIIGFVPTAAAPAGLYVSAGIGIDDAFQPLNDAATLGLALAVGGVVAAFLATWFTGRALVRRPVQNLLATVEAWRRGNDRARTGMSAQQGEIGSVGHAIDEFMDEIVADRKLRQDAEQHRELLLHELDHRVKNILATVQAIARQTFRSDVDRAEAMDVFTARLGAIANAHSLLVSGRWRSADLSDIVDAATAPFRRSGDGRFALSGPSLVVEAKPALALSMALHELCTNSVKYGALSNDDGRVIIRWSAEDGEFHLDWREKDGPPVQPPSHKGFGSRMIERLLAAEIGATIELTFAESGVCCVVKGPLSAVVAEPGSEPSRPSPKPAEVAPPGANPALSSA
jgi:two-component sensor histidine kinase